MTFTTSHRLARRIPAGALLATLLLVSACSGADEPSATAPSAPTSSAGPEAQLLDRALQEQAAGKTNQAKADFEALAKMDPKNKYAYYNLGVIAQLGGDEATAVKHYDQVLELDAAFNPALYNLAILTDERGDAKKAAELYQRAIKSNPDDAGAHFNLGLLLRRLGKSAQSVREINRAVELDPKFKARIPTVKATS